MGAPLDYLWALSSSAFTKDGQSPPAERLAHATAALPALASKTSVSLNAFSPIRLAPCSPPTASPAAKSPGTEVTPVASIRAPPMV